MRPSPVLLLPAAAGGLAVLLAARPAATEPDPAATERSLAAFSDIARVLRHPRCLNCHPMGDRPHVDDEARLHGMNVQRGPDGHGAPGLHCSTCHRDANQDLVGVPGAPHWHLAPRPMGWEGLDDHDLAATLIDRAKNGDRSLGDLREHMAHDPLVLWGWNPGAGRSAVPTPHDQFIAALDAWIEDGAPLPAPGVTSSY
ncbi:MAG: hypothetical protein AAFZ65_15600 [Planctomycetota bacterium]